MSLLRRAPVSTDALLLAAVIAAGAALRFVALSKQSFWFDEALTVGLAKRGLFDMLHHIPGSEADPPLYYVLAWAWRHVFGSGEAGLRSLSALAGTAAIPVAWAAGRELVSSRVGLVAAAIVAVNPMLIWYSQEARAYSLVVLLAAMSFWLFLLARRRRTAGSLAAWAAVSSLAILTHYAAAFLILAEAAWLFWELPRMRRAVVAAIGTVGLVGLVLLPLAVHQADGRTDWVGSIPLADRLWDVLRELGSGNTFLISSGWAAPGGAWAILGFAGVVAGGILVVTLGPGRARRGAACSAAVGAAALAIPLLLSPTRFDTFLDRNLIGAWFPLAVALAVGIGATTRRVVGVMALALLLLASIGVTLMVPRHAHLQRTDWRDAAAALGTPRVARAVVVKPGYLAGPAGNGSVLAVYGHTLRAMPDGARVREVVVVHGPDPEPKGPAPPGPPGFTLVEERHLQDVAFLRYRAARPHPLGYSAALLARSDARVLLERPSG
jgi:4-amino-4-deoxy-L-arabinose transferase-like glycosyltransferase